MSFERFLANWRHAGRSLLRAPLLPGVCVVCLAVGIGATSSMVEAVDTLLLRSPPGVQAPDELATLGFTVAVPGQTLRTASMLDGGITYDDYRTLRQTTSDLRTSAAFFERQLSLGRGTSAQPVRVGFVTDSLFALLGARPALGSLIADDDLDASRSELPAVISSTLWHAQFGGDSTIVGKDIQVGKATYRVAGVAGSHFRGLDILAPTDVWLPVGAAIDEMFAGRRDAFRAHSEGLVRVVARIADPNARSRIAQEAAAREQAAYVARFGSQVGNNRSMVSVNPLVPGLRGSKSTDGSVALWLTCVAVIVLAIAMANVSGLLLVRAADREHDVAVRRALGASPRQVAELLLCEGLILALAGGVVSLVVRRLGSATIHAFLLPPVLGAPRALDARVLGVSACAAILIGIICSLVPTLHTFAADIRLSASGLSAPHVSPRVGARSVLLVLQVALATALVGAAALFLTSWNNLRTIPLGFAPEHLLVGRMSPWSVGYAPSESRAAFVTALERVRHLPGVESAALVSHVPFVDPQGNPVRIPGVAPEVIQTRARSPLGPELNAVTPSFFSAMGIRVVAGRSFDDHDGVGAEPVVIVNARMAKTFWPGGDAVGHCVAVARWGSNADEATPCARIIGIAADAKSMSVLQRPDLQIYAPFAQRDGDTPAALVVRTTNPTAMETPVRLAMQSVSRDLPFADVHPMTDYLETELRPRRLAAAMFGIFGVIAALLAAIGLYGVFAYTVSRQAREIGIRMALGARSADIMSLIVVRGLRLAAIGAVIGAALAVGIGRTLEAFLIGITPASPILAISIAITAAMIALASVAFPAWRAARIDPAIAMRAE